MLKPDTTDDTTRRRRPIAGRLLAVVLAACLSLLPGFPPAWAANWTMSYQGNVRKSGIPLTGSHTVGFKIYPSSTSAAPIWVGPTESVTFNRGLFAVTLEPALDWEGTQPHLEIAVDGVTLSPREELNAAAYAYNAKRLSGKVYASSPTTPASAAAGDLWYDTNANALSFYNGGAWVSSVGGLSAVTSNPQQFSGNGTAGDPLTLRSSSVTLQGNAFNGADQLLKLDNLGRYPALDGSLIAGLSDSTRVLKAGDAMTGPLTMWNSTITIAGNSGNAFSVGVSTLVVKDGMIGAGTTNPLARLDLSADDAVLGLLIGDSAASIPAKQGLYLWRDWTTSRVESLQNALELRTTRTSDDIIFTADSSEAMRVDATNGWVGIGASAPQEKLHVSSGNAVVDFGIRTSTLTFAAGLSGDPAAAAKGMLYYNASTDKLKLYDGGWKDIATGSTGDYVAKAGDSMSGQLSVRGASVEVSSISTLGSVGIGGIGLSGGTLVVKSTSADATNPVVNVQANNGAELMRVQQDGKVGVGTTNPATAVDINNSAGRTWFSGSQIGVVPAGTGSGVIAVDRPVENGSTISVFRASSLGAPKWRFGTAPDSNDLYFVDEANALERMRIAQSGNIGVGTSSPQEKLHVSSGNAVVDFGIRTSTLTFAAGLTGDPATPASGMLYYKADTGKLRLYNGSWIDLVTGASGDFVSKAGDAMTGQLTLAGSTLTVGGDAFSVGGSTFVVTGGSVAVSGNMSLASDAGLLRFGSSADVLLGRDAADTLALARGGNPQELRVYRTTNGTDSEFLKTGWNSAGIFQVATGKTGAGSRDALYLSGGGTYPYEGLTIGTDGTMTFVGGPFATAVYIKAGLAGGSAGLGLTRLDGSMIGSILGGDDGTTEIRSQGLYNAFFGRTSDALYRPLVIQEASMDAAAYYSRLKLGFGLSTDFFDVQAYQTSGEGTAASLALNPSGGNVGIGTTSPKHALDVNGGAVVRSSVTLAGISSTPNAVAGQGAIYFDTEDGKFKVSENAGGFTDLVAAAGTYVARAGDAMTGQLTIRGASVGVSSFSALGAVGIGGIDLGNGTLVVKSTSTDATNPVVNVQANNGTELMRVQQDGRVGIGITAPEVKLSVNGGVMATDSGAFLINGAGLFRLMHTNLDFQGANGATIWNRDANATADLQLSVATDGGVEVKAVRVKHGTGLVGVGTTDPGHMLSVRSSFLVGTTGAETDFAGFNPGFTINQANPTMALINNTAAADNRIWTGFELNGTQLFGRVLNDAVDTTQNWITVTRANASVASVGFPNGVVGIGTTVPQEKLHVSSGNAVVDFGMRLSTLTFAAGLTGDPAAAAKGMLYYNASTDKLKLYDGGWKDLATGSTGDYVAKAGDAMTGQLTLVGSTLTVTGNAFSVAGSTFTVKDGNIGIGTSSPVSGRLEVSGDNPAWTAVFRNTMLDQGGVTVINAGTSPAVPAFHVRSNGGANSLLQVREDGNVGVGTTSPAQKIHMSSGTLLIDGDADAAFKVGVSSLVVNSEGKVGVGTTSPVSRLHILGGDYLAGLRVESDEGLGAGIGIKSTSAGGKHFNIYSSGPSNGEGAGKLVFQDNAVGARMVVDPIGNIGVGTASPAYRLDVSGGGMIVRSSFTLAEMSAPPLSATDQGAIYFDATADKFRVSENGGGYVDLLNQASAGGWTDGGTAVRLSDAGDKVGIGTTSPAEKLHLSSGTLLIDGDVSTAFKVGVSSFIVDSGGRVGIGTSEPSFKLHIDGAASATQGVRIANMASGAQSLSLGSNGEVQVDSPGVEGGRFIIKEDGSVGVGTTGPAAKLHLSSGTLLVDGDAAMPFRVGVSTLAATSSGQVGIGTTAPDQSLHIKDASGTPGRANVHVEATTENAYLVLQADAWTGNQTGTFVKMGNTGALKINNAGSSSPDHLVINNQGQVGVGAVPSARLHVSSSNAVAADTILLVSSGTSTGQELLVVKGDGKVGVGTTDPGAKLDVDGVVLGRSYAGFGGAGVANPYFTLYASRNFTAPATANPSTGLRLDGTIAGYATGGHNMYGALLMNSFAEGATSGTHDLIAQLYVGGGAINTAGGASTTDAATVYISGAMSGASNNYALYSAGGTNYFGGNVGVGTTDPGAKLDVSGGNIKTTGASGAQASVYVNKPAATDAQALTFQTGGTDKWNLGVRASNTYLEFWDSPAGTNMLTLTTGGNFRIGNHANDVYPLTVDGDVAIGQGTVGCVVDRDGTIIAGTCVSDERLKKDVRPFAPVLEKVAALRPVTYNWRSEEFPEFHFNEAAQTGLIAQEVERALPELVETDPKGFKRVNYSQLPLYLLQAVKEQQAEIAALREELAELKARR
ncbi:MAG: tail fiber domain-containing protein [Elusimicrobia bacterium]|nr:tail fiber domain-containing protein [Elusimicrobiota bacterium]